MDGYLYYRGRDFPTMNFRQAFKLWRQHADAGRSKHVIDAWAHGGHMGEYIVVDPPMRPIDQDW